MFSIVIPTYNRSSDLVRCLNSLVTQTYKNFEVIVCDNGSSDNTKEVIKKYEKQLNLEYIYLTENSGGPAKPRNIGAANAKGVWICFLDSDDLYEENKLEYISKLNLDNIDFIYHNLTVIKGGLKFGKLKPRKLSNANSYYDLLFNMNAIPTSSVCVRKEIFDKTNGFKETKEIAGLEDFHLWINLARMSVRFYYIPKQLGCYFVGNDNFTVTDERQINRYRILYQEFLDLEENQANKAKIKAALDYHTGWVYYKNKDFKIGTPFLMKSAINGTVMIKLRSVYFLLKNIGNLS
jgi:glycosyltransferase involved in cell wall biosynthesis